MLKENGEGQAREGVCVFSDQTWDLGPRLSAKLSPLQRFRIVCDDCLKWPLLFSGVAVCCCVLGI